MSRSNEWCHTDERVMSYTGTGAGQVQHRDCSWLRTGTSFQKKKNLLYIYYIRKFSRELTLRVSAWLRANITVSTQNEVLPISTKSRNLDSRYRRVQIQIEILIAFELVPRNVRFWMWGVLGM